MSNQIINRNADHRELHRERCDRCLCVELMEDDNPSVMLRMTPPLAQGRLWGYRCILSPLGIWFFATPPEALPQPSGIFL